MQRLVLVILVLLINNAVALQNWLSSIRVTHKHTSLHMRLLNHGEGFKYLPIQKASSDEYFPRILPIAGVYPSITLEQVLSPVTSPVASIGTWSYEFTDPNGSQLGTVALPGSHILHHSIDPIVLITKNTDLNIRVIEEVEMLVVVDRGDREFDSQAFFLFLTPTNELTIKWTEDLPEDHQVVGRIILCWIPYTEMMAPKKTGFLEEDDE